MDQNRADTPDHDSADHTGWVTLFEDRYGAGAQDRLLELFRQPCVTFASIAQAFGVTRECVRQWHRRLLPDAPTGHQRQRQCRLLQRRRHLFQDRLFLAFYRRIRNELPAARITLIPSRDGFRKRAIRIEGQLVILARAVAVPGGGAAFRLPGIPWDARFVYCELGAADFLFVPRGLASSRSRVSLDAPDSPHQLFRNSFGALPLRRSCGAPAVELAGNCAG